MSEPRQAFRASERGRLRWQLPTERRRLVLGLAAGGIALIGLACGDSESGSAGPSKGETRSAPDFRLIAYQGADHLGGRERQMREIIALGKPVVLNFWAGLCPPCRAEMPDFQAAYEARRDEVTIVGVDVGSYVGLGSTAEGKALAKELGITYPLATTSDREVIRAYGLVGMPSTVFIAPDGTIVRRRTGILSKVLLTQLIDELLEASKA